MGCTSARKSWASAYVSRSLLLYHRRPVRAPALTQPLYTTTGYSHLPSPEKDSLTLKTSNWGAASLPPARETVFLLMNHRLTFLGYKPCYGYKTKLFSLRSCRRNSREMPQTCSCSRTSMKIWLVWCPGTQNIFSLSCTCILLPETTAFSLDPLLNEPVSFMCCYDRHSC